MNTTTKSITALLTAVFCSAVLAESEDIARQDTPAQSVLTIDISSLANNFRNANIQSLQCQNAIKEFEKTIAGANANAAASRKKIVDVAKTYLKTCMEKAQTSGNLDKVLMLKSALESFDDGIKGEAEEIIKIREGIAAQQLRIDQDLVSSAIAAAKKLHAVLDLQKNEMTRNGELRTAQTIATLQKTIVGWANAIGQAGQSSSLRSYPNNIFGYTRNPTMRNRLLLNGGGNAKTEAAVLRSLRWLKSVQNPDGSWPNNKVAMTGFALLTFLAHGEIPSSSTEFGETVQRAINYLISEQTKTGSGLFTRTGGGYAHAIATYAMCEAYGMTLDEDVKKAADDGLAVIISGQHPSGGWDYNWKQSERNDTSIMGWAAQALKAAMVADFYHSPKALKHASDLCVMGFKRNGFQDGGFGYTRPEKGGLTGVGVLCMQFHKDEKGQFQEIGLWVNTDAHTDRPVMDTCLAALQLMTYYRYLPLSKRGNWRR